MINIKSFGVLGGDRRQIEMAKSMSNDGYNVYVSGFEKYDLMEENILNIDAIDMIEQSECIILPLPVIKDKNTLNAPLSDIKLILDDKFAEKLRGKKVFCGMASKLYKISDKWRDIKVYDYYEREDYAIKNAVLTAEGALAVAIKEYTGTISGSRCLVSGFGRIGKVLAKILKDMGAQVTVSARKEKDLAWIDVLGYKAIKTQSIGKTKGYDIIFNTIPYMVFDYKMLLSSAKGSIIIDLASFPGGVDFNAAQSLKIKTIHALSLPGQIAPKTAGEITKETIYNMLEEDGG